MLKYHSLNIPISFLINVPCVFLYSTQNLSVFPGEKANQLVNTIRLDYLYNCSII